MSFSCQLSKTDQDLIRAFKNLEDLSDVANLLEVSSGYLAWIIFKKDPANNYKKFLIPKRGGRGSREICAPIHSLKILQKKLNYILNLVYKVKKPAHGFINKRSVRSNATPHVRKRHIYNLDLKDFFSTITYPRVFGVFKQPPYRVGYRAAAVLARLVTFNGRLPQGSPTSPIISNMICARLDGELLQLANDNFSYYTRYADDITFSTTNLVLDELREKITEKIGQNGFSINDKKVRLSGRSQRQEVTGLVVNKKINVKRSFIRRLRAMLHAIEKFGLGPANTEFHRNFYFKNINTEYKSKPNIDLVIKSRLSWLRFIRGENDQTYRNLARKFYKLIEEPAGKPIPEHLKNFEEWVSARLWFSEYEKDDGHTHQGTAFMLPNNQIVTCEHATGTNMRIKRVVDTNWVNVNIARSNTYKDLAVLSFLNPPQEEMPHFLLASQPDYTVQSSALLTGFPEHHLGDQTPHITPCIITNRFNQSSVKFFRINTPTITGNSGGPILNNDNEVIGVAAKGFTPGEHSFNECVFISELENL